MQSPRRPASGSYFSEDTIAAPGSAFGGAVGIIRVSGPAAFETLQALAPKTQVLNHPPRSLFRVRLQDDQGQTLDEVLAVRFQGPESYTGEDSVEYHLHGNILLAQSLMQELAKKGVRKALPGEFSFRAVRNGKMSLSQASGVADLVAAANSSAIQLALEKLSEQQNLWISQIAENLRSLALEAESAIDFSDQDLGETPLPGLRLAASKIQIDLERLGGTFDRGKRIQEGVRVAFLGLPNSGKSSLFNTLLGEDRSIVSDIPGTTRDVIGEHLTLHSSDASATFRLEDTAGLRESQDQIESLGIQRSLRAANDADLLIFVIDGSASETWNAAISQWRSLKAPSERTLLVLNKVDLLTPDQEQAVQQRAHHAFQIEACLPCSATHGKGIDALVSAMVRFCEKWYRRDPGEYLLTRAEHAEAVQSAAEHIRRAGETTELALFASDIRQGLHCLAPLIGETVPDDILNAIFSRFCIGK